MQIIRGRNFHGFCGLASLATVKVFQQIFDKASRKGIA